MLLLLLPLIFQALGGSLSQMPGYKLEVPEAVTVQEGLCIQVPCSFSYPSVLQFYRSQAFGYWFKKGANTDSDKPVATNDPKREVQEETSGRFHLIGDPLKNNCSEGQSCHLGRDIPLSGEPRDISGMVLRLLIKVGGSCLRPGSCSFPPDLTEKPDVYIPGTLEPGHLVKVICVAPSLSECGKPPIFSWTGAILSSLEFKRETLHFSEMTLTPRPQNHGSNLSCQVTVPGAKVSLERTVHLNVTYSNGILTFSKGILLGAGIMALLALCLILALVKFLRKKQVKDSDPLDSKEVPDANEVSREVPLDQQRDPSFPLCSPVTQESSEEIHYASLNFRKISP
ncbi:myeloid cell surface antigen CD33-like [Petaurus breviceps papuanus]|uniref:myeloid cell surface antigen CD33-like n=1 Tax=Petaurus breviceps papuanus TaxID=3040969 RepID=UPI0036D80518